MARWKIMVLKLLWVLETFSLKRRTQAVLGEDSYKRLFQRAKEETRRNDSGPDYHRLINGEVVGKPLQPGKGIPQVDPQMCNHPTSEMKRRGNKKNTKGGTWWTCSLCLSRWERMDLPTETGNPKSTEIMLTGPHEGKTFQEIWENEHQYCHWIRLTADTNPPETNPDSRNNQQIYRLAHYLHQMETVGSEAMNWDDDDEKTPSEESFREL
jgi:hypothetical protein